MSSWEDSEEATSPPEMVMVWEACCSNAPPPLLPHRSREDRPTNGDLDSPHARAKAKLEQERQLMIETALLEKLLKNKLSVAAEHFNRDYKKGFQYLQVRYPTPLPQ